MSKPWHSIKVEQALKELNTSIEGLSSKEAFERLKKYGFNEIKETKRRTVLQMFLDEFKDIFILLLIAATILSAIVGYYEMSRGEEFTEAFADVITISAIVLLCAITGFIQEYRAEKAVEALKRLAAPKARVIRDGKEIMIPAKEVVPGDIITLEAGDRVPADARLIEVVELKTNEAVLTGESTPVEKRLTILKEDVPVSERHNMIFSATHVVYGRGKAVVVTTGM
ncbi:MAG: HAD-IC family P-type ATPase, partial [Thermoproteota archaeon]